MARIAFTAHLREVGPGDAAEYDGATLAEVLDSVAVRYPRLKSYLLDDQGRVRKHVAIFIDGTLCPRETALARPVTPRTDIFVFQALSGG